MQRLIHELINNISKTVQVCYRLGNTSTMIGNITKITYSKSANNQLSATLMNFDLHLLYSLVWLIWSEFPLHNIMYSDKYNISVHINLIYG